MTTSKSRQPVKLLKNISFPTFQLHAVVNNKIDDDIAFRILILETMSWLRKRFRELEIPDEIMLPEPEDYENVSENDLKSFHINEGYMLDVVYIKEQGIWSLRLIEPDLGPEPGNQNQKRRPVPGRVFKTNIAFIKYNGKIECGFKTLCLEPEGTKAPCEVFRLAIVKSIVRNDLLGLKQIYPIVEEAHYIDNIRKIKKLKKFIDNKDRQIPLVILTEYIPRVDLSSIKEQFLNTQLDYRNLKNNILYNDEAKKIQRKPKLPFKADNIIKYRMGYAQFAIISKKEIEAFNRIVGKEYSVSEGDVRIIYPLKFNEETELYKFNDIVSNENYFSNFLENKLQNYPKGKKIAFGNVKFLNEAKIIQQEQIISRSNSKEETIKANQIKLENIRQIHEENINILKREIEEKNNIISRLKTKISLQEDELKNKDENWKSRIEEQENEYNKNIVYLKDEIKRKDLLLERPNKPEDVPNWVDKHFSDKLIFHKKAKDLIRKTPASEIDMELLCDAIEFLAYEYRDQILGIKNKEEINNICSKKYNRPFDVGSSGDLSVCKYPKEYKIKYGKGFTGKPVEVPLNMHLKVGNDNENLLRIYFLFDKVKELIVIGSLPKHLSTILYK